MHYLNAKSIVTILFIAIHFLGFGQGKFEFMQESYDFGLVNEGDQATFTFKFKNIGNQPILLSSVRASCGCTTPSWSKDPVLPGKTGEITASFNSAGRPGVFHKSITISSNALENTKVLNIKGVVEKNETSIYTAEEIAKSPKMQLNKNVFDLGTVLTRKKIVSSSTIENTGKTPLQIKSISSACRCISIDFDRSQTTIDPGKKGTLYFIYTSYQTGLKNEVGHIKSNDITDSQKKLSIKATVVNTLPQNSIMMENKSVSPF